MPVSRKSLVINMRKIIDGGSLFNGSKIFLLDDFDACDYIVDQNQSRNIIMIDSNGIFIWQVRSNFDNDCNPFTNIWIDDFGILHAYRWDGGDYVISVDSGYAKPLTLMK